MHVERVGNLLKCVERNVSVAALDRTYIGAMKVTLVGKGLLREALLSAQSLDTRGGNRIQWLFSHIVRLANCILSDYRLYVAMGEASNGLRVLAD